jgi:dual-specificity kinase
MPQPAGKRRRTGIETAYDLGYYDRPSFSINPQQYGEESSAGSLSTDRTASLHTTAPTSLSQGSSGASNGAYYEEANVGQKRKRVTTRKSVRDEQKKREQETATDAFLSYIPPPNPPVKAKDVPVPVIRSVSVDVPLFYLCVHCTNLHSTQIGAKSLMTMMVTTSSLLIPP